MTEGPRRGSFIGRKLLAEHLGLHISGVPHARETSKDPGSVPAEPVAKPLEYQLIDLLEHDGAGPEEQAAIWILVRFLRAHTR